MDHSLKNPQTTPIIYKLYTTQEKSHWALTYVLYEKMTLECKKLNQKMIKTPTASYVVITLH